MKRNPFQEEAWEEAREEAWQETHGWLRRWTHRWTHGRTNGKGRGSKHEDYGQTVGKFLNHCLESHGGKTTKIGREKF